MREFEIWLLLCSNSCRFEWGKWTQTRLGLRFARFLFQRFAVESVRSITFCHLLSLSVTFKLFGKFGNFWTLHLAKKCLAGLVVLVMTFAGSAYLVMLGYVKLDQACQTGGPIGCVWRPALIFLKKWNTFESTTKRQILIKSVKFLDSKWCNLKSSA